MRRMTVVTISIIGIAAVLMAVQLKGLKGEYGIYLAAAAGLVIFFYSAGKLQVIVEVARRIEEYIKINNVYLTTLLKMIGITYIGQFSSGICRDAGYSSTGAQIELFCRLSVMVLSMPVLLALLDTIQGFLA